jgi:hypothetical protein
VQEKLGTRNMEMNREIENATKRTRTIKEILWLETKAKCGSTLTDVNMTEIGGFIHCTF